VFAKPGLHQKRFRSRVMGEPALDPFVTRKWKTSGDRTQRNNIGVDQSSIQNVNWLHCDWERDF
jgi:hypothetical protein